MEYSVEGVLVDAAKRLNARHAQYGNARSYYKRAAVNASHKLNREVSEYEVLAHELAVFEARVAMDREDYSAYVESVLLTALAAQFCLPTEEKNFDKTLRTDMAETLRDAVLPSVDVIPEIEQAARSNDEPPKQEG